MHLLKRHMAARVAQQQNQMTDASRRANGEGSNDVTMADATGAGGTPADGTAQPNPSSNPPSNQPPAPETLPGFPRGAWEHVEEVMQVLKTTFPLLILSLETMVDQIQHKFKLSPEEEVYRNVCMLMQDAIQVGSSLLVF